MNFLSGLPSQCNITLEQTKWTTEPYWRSSISKIIMRINLAILLIIFTSMHLWATGKAQTISLQLKNVTLEEALKQIGKQANYGYFFEKGTTPKSKNINLNLSNATIKNALDQCFAEQPFTYELNNEMIVVKPKGILEKVTDYLKTITGKVTDENGKPLVGVSINVKGGNRATKTDADGNYKIEADEKSILVFSYIGYQTQEIQINNQITFNLVLKEAVGVLDEQVVRGYGSTTQRLNTGNIGVVKAETIGSQPVTNPLQALVGQLAGVSVVQGGGLPGAGFAVRIRGRNSIAANNEPLYIVDGVPFSSDGLTPSALFVEVSPFNSISPNDIESITVLKDADATAIYGSRAANGVILITTKKGQYGKPKLNVNVSNGYGSVTNTVTPLTTTQYLQLRRDAFANSALTPTATTAPDLLSWDQKTDNNLQEWLIGGTAKSWDANASISGGNQQFNFLVSGTFHQENTIRSSRDKYQRSNAHFSVGFVSDNKKLQMGLSSFYSNDNNKLTNKANASLINIAGSIPNYPIYDSNGNYNWLAQLDNFVALSTAYWQSDTKMLNGNLNLKYEIVKNLNIQGSIGYNIINNDTMIPTPSSSINPTSSIKSSNSFSAVEKTSLVFEPQLNYTALVGQGKLEVLIGGTIQKNTSFDNTINFINYINELLLESQTGGTFQSAVSHAVDYRYLSGFARLSYNWQNKYIVNGTFRRDGSTRFGPGKQFGNFGSIGAGWLFANENWLKSSLPWLSYGKLRGSWGTTGSDGIGDYGYLSVYSTGSDYGTQKSIAASQIANKDFQWEINKKLEFALELGFLKDKVLFNTSWYRNRSGNQLVTYPLSSTTGFTGYIANMPALVQNSGWEFELNTQNLSRKNLIWNTSFNLTIPKNKLISFPNIELTSYANTLVIGESIGTVLRYHLLGIDPQTGLSQIEDVDGDGAITARSRYNGQNGDYQIAGTTDPTWYAGLNNSFSFKGFKLDVFLQYVRQSKDNIYRSNFSNFGRLSNFWTTHLDYWKNPGDISTLPKPFAATNVSLSRFGSTDYTFSDASYLRLGNIAFSYSLPTNFVKKAGFTHLSINIQGQNILTVSDFLGYDPSTGAVSIPQLKIWSVGLKATL